MVIDPNALDVITLAALIEGAGWLFVLLGTIYILGSLFVNAVNNFTDWFIR